MSKTPTTLGALLRQLREGRQRPDGSRLRLQDVADAIGSDKGTISLMERDLREPSLEQLAGLARYFGTTRAELLRVLDGPPHTRRLARTGT